MFIDFLRLNVFDIPRDSHLAHHGGDFFATLSRKLLRIVHALDTRVIGQHDGANGKRTCDRASAHFIEPHSDAASCKFCLEAVHALQASRFRVFGGEAARGAFQGSFDPLAFIGGKSAGKRLVFRAIRGLQGFSYFCKRSSHSFPSFLGDDSFSMRRSISHTQNGNGHRWNTRAEYPDAWKMKQERGPEGPLPKHQFGKDLECLFLDLGSLAHLVAQVVQLGTTDLAVTHDLDLLDLGGVHGEGTLNANAEADLADGEGLAAGVAVTTDNVALENLDALAVTLGNAIVHLDRVADVERGDFLDLLLLDSADDIHFVSFC